MAAEQLTPVGLDALPPREMAAEAEEIGVTKAGLDTLTMFALAVLAGAFIAMGAVLRRRPPPAAPISRSASHGCSAA